MRKYIPKLNEPCVVIPHNNLWGFGDVKPHKGKVIAYANDKFVFDYDNKFGTVVGRIDKVDFEMIDGETKATNSNIHVEYSNSTTGRKVKLNPCRVIEMHDVALHYINGGDCEFNTGGASWYTFLDREADDIFNNHNVRIKKCTPKNGEVWNVICEELSIFDEVALFRNGMVISLNDEFMFKIDDHPDCLDVRMASGVKEYYSK